MPKLSISPTIPTAPIMPIPPKIPNPPKKEKTMKLHQHILTLSADLETPVGLYLKIRDL